MDSIIRQNTVLEYEPPSFPSLAVVYPFIEDSGDVDLRSYEDQRKDYTGDRGCDWYVSNVECLTKPIESWLGLILRRVEKTLFENVRRN